MPKLPGIEGIERFGGSSFHTSRWDYAFTGGDAGGAPLDKLADLRVAVIGTGATAVQCVPELAKACKELYVFQRTPSSVDVRGNEPIDPDWFATIATAGWQQRWPDNFTANWEGFLGARLTEELEDLVKDGWTDLGRRIRDALRAVPARELTRELLMDVYEDADNVKMDEIRARVDSVVADPGTAANLKGWYRQLCKRPCFHDEYLQAFNRPNTHLVDTDGKGVQRITAAGVVAGGREYPVDCIIYASGFEFGIGHDITRRTGFDPVGRNGTELSRHWATGIRTLHGTHVAGFPNMFLVQLPQGAALASNVPHNYVEATKAIAAVARHAVDREFAAAEVTKEAEDAWVDYLLAKGRPAGRADCTPGYYNNEGQPRPESRLNVGYPQGATAFFAMLDEWRQAGTFTGLSFR